MAHQRSRQSSTSVTSPFAIHPIFPHMKRDGHPPMKKKPEFPKPTKQNRSTLHKVQGAHTPSSATDENESGIHDGNDADSEEADNEDDDLPCGSDASGISKGLLIAGKRRIRSKTQNEMQDSDVSDTDSKVAEEETEFEVAEDDDDYDGVDGVSEVSDDSAAFEAEVEHEIFAMGEGAIDWDDKEIYSYAEIGMPNGDMYDSAASLSHLMFPPAPEWDFDALPEGIISPTIEPQIKHPVVEFHSKTWSPKLDIDWDGEDSSGSNSDSASDGTPEPSPIDPVASEAAAIEFLIESGASPFDLRLDPGQETDEDEPPTRTVSSPAVTLSRHNSESTPSTVRNRLIDPATPRRVGLKPPVKGKLKINPNKPIAYAVDGPRLIVFKTPKGSKMAWIDMRRSGGHSDDSAPSSPTMVDLDAALLEGNQRTGAAITDVIYGHMFRQYHCNDIDFAIYAQPTSHAEFARVPFLNNGGMGSLFSDGNFPDSFASLDSDEANGIEPEMQVLELIDFEGGARDDEMVENQREVTPERLEFSYQTPESVTPRARNKGKARLVDSPELRRIQGSSTPTRPSRSTPDIASSPFKRRAPTRSVSPITKRKRVAAAQAAEAIQEAELGVCFATPLFA